MIIDSSMPRASGALLTVHSSPGETVAALIDEELLWGQDRATWNAAAILSGISFCKVLTEKPAQTKRMLLLT